MFTELNRLLNLIYLTIKLCGYHWGEGGPSTGFLKRKENPLPSNHYCF